MINFVIMTVPHKDQRYDTAGDWKLGSGNRIDIPVSAMGSWRMEALVGVHELVEAILCKARRVQEQAVTDFDTDFETRRPDGNTEEPGDHPDAPYYREHQIATAVERLLAVELGVNWGEYEKTILALSKERVVGQTA